MSSSCQMSPKEAERTSIDRNQGLKSNLSDTLSDKSFYFNAGPMTQALELFEPTTATKTNNDGFEQATSLVRFPII